MILVARSPTKKPIRGFEVVLMSVSANSLPKPLKAWLIKEMLIRKKYKRRKTTVIFKMYIILLSLTVS